MERSRLIISKFQWLFNKRLRIWYHVLFWMFFYLDMVFDLAFADYFDEYLLITYVLQLVLDMFLVYANNYLLLPRLLFRNKNLLYLLVVFSLLLILVSLNYYLQYFFLFEYFYDELFWTPEEGWMDRLSTFLNVFSFQASIIGAGSGIKIFKIFLQDRFRMQNMEIAQLESELNQLKAQLNPHFLFNALNNIYVLTKIDQEKAQEAIELLSGLLRYQLYECTRPEVPLENELEYLRAFIQMEKIRKKDMKVDFQLEGSPEGKFIAPLLLITFIENAVKHGVSAAGSGWIRIRISVGTTFSMTVENSLNPERKMSKGGIGLKNLERRLSLIYPQNHRIKTEMQADRYFAWLEIALDDRNRQNPA